MKWRTCASTLGISLLWACSPPTELAEPTAAPPISGAQIDSMQKAVRDAGLPQSEWMSVLRRDDGTRAVVHARRSTDASPDEQDEFCSAVRALTSPELEVGQTLEIYIIRSKSVAACR